MSRGSPWLPRWLLRVLLPARDREFILGDLEEEFLRVRVSRGRPAAWLLYWRQAIASVMREAEYGVTSEESMVRGEPRRGSFFDAVRQDLRFAFRALNRRPVFTSIAVITLALGIGANTAIFSVANALLLRPVPGIPAQDDLAIVDFGTETRVALLSWPNLVDLQSTLERNFTGVFGIVGAEMQVVAQDAQPVAVSAHAVAGDYFGVLGVRPQLGRPILPEETVPGPLAAVAVISDQLWSSMFQRDAQVLGRTIRANRLSFTIVGVAPRHFRGLERTSTIDLWVPYSMYGEIRHYPPDHGPAQREFSALQQLVGRLRPAVTSEAAQAELRIAMAALVEAHPKENAFFADVPARVHAGIGLHVRQRAHIESAVKVMLVVVLLLLLISAANVANMLLVRGMQRAPETAVRRALGASTSRLAAQDLTESLVLTLAGGAISLVLAKAFLKLMAGGQLFGLPVIDAVPMDWRVLVFTFVVCLLTGVVFALTPLVVLRWAGFNRAFAASSGRVTARGSWVRSSIVVGQTALSLALLIGALLLGRTIRNLMAVDIGFDADRVIGFSLQLEPQAYDQAGTVRFGRSLLDELRSLPEVESAALNYALPFSCCGFKGRVDDPLRRSDEKIWVKWQHVSGEYFSTVGIDVLEGRPLEERDQVDPNAAVKNVVLSEAAAKRLFDTRPALGQTLLTSARQPEQLQVVGIARDVRIASLDEPGELIIYQPISVYPLNGLAAVVRPRAGAVGLEPAIRRAVAAVDPALPFSAVTRVSDNVRDSITEQRFFATMLTLFSSLAVLLAAVGLYGVLAFSVSQRVREIGIRMALGAGVSRILSLVASQSLRMVGIGIAGGVLFAVWLSRLLESRLFGVERLDPVVYGAAALLFVAIAAIATVIPTRAAVRVQPGIALRNE